MTRWYPISYKTAQQLPLRSHCRSLLYGSALQFTTVHSAGLTAAVFGLAHATNATGQFLCVCRGLYGGSKYTRLKCKTLAFPALMETFTLVGLSSALWCACVDRQGKARCVWRTPSGNHTTCLQVTGRVVLGVDGALCSSAWPSAICCAPVCAPAASCTCHRAHRRSVSLQSPGARACVCEVFSIGS